VPQSPSTLAFGRAQSPVSQRFPTHGGSPKAPPSALRRHGMKRTGQELVRLWRAPRRPFYNRG
jgi:hypothetical protein